jgi:hypothetical protein
LVFGPRKILDAIGSCHAVTRWRRLGASPQTPRIFEEWLWAVIFKWDVRYG